MRNEADAARNHSRHQTSRRHESDCCSRATVAPDLQLQLGGYACTAFSSIPWAGPSFQMLWTASPCRAAVAIVNRRWLPCELELLLHLQGSIMQFLCRNSPPCDQTSHGLLHPMLPVGAMQGPAPDRATTDVTDGGREVSPELPEPHLGLQDDKRNQPAGVAVQPNCRSLGQRRPAEGRLDFAALDPITIDLDLFGVSSYFRGSLEHALKARAEPQTGNA